METLCVYPGSFDPITLGHLDLIRRAARIFPRVLVAVMINPDKQGVFSQEERLEMIRDACREIPNVEAEAFSGLTVDYLRLKGAQVLLRGIRSAADLEAEAAMARMNRILSGDTAETLLLLTDPMYAHVSSSMVRQVAAFNGDISALVPPVIHDRVVQRLNKQS